MKSSAIRCWLCAMVLASLTTSLPNSNFTRKPDSVELPIEEYREADQRQLQQSPRDRQAYRLHSVISGAGIETAVNNSSLRSRPIRNVSDDFIAINGRDKDTHLRESGGSWCDPRQKRTDWPCYRNYRYRCYKKYCMRTWTPRAHLGKQPNGFYWYDRYEGGYFKCSTNDQCLESWKSIEAKKPGYIPCTNRGYWRWYCHQGLHYGCSRRGVCWHEHGNLGWDGGSYDPSFTYTNIKCTKSKQHKVCNRYKANFRKVKDLSGVRPWGVYGR